MNKQIAEWDEEEPRDDWWQYQKDFATAADTIARLRAALERNDRALKEIADSQWHITWDAVEEIRSITRAALEGEG